jgi:hypothetical protein
MIITKKEFNAIKTLKRFLSKIEWQDFKQLINKNISYIEIEINNNVTINFFDNDYNKKLIYSMIIERTLGFKVKFSFSIKKNSLQLLEKYIFSNDIVLKLIKQLNDNDEIEIDLRYKRIKFWTNDLFYGIPIEDKPKLRVMKLIGGGKN